MVEPVGLGDVDTVAGEAASLADRMGLDYLTGLALVLARRGE